MEIRFSESFYSCAVRPLAEYINDAAGAIGCAVTVPRQSPRNLPCLRFRLLDASEAEHDSVIRSLLELDPGATIRTARAVYEGRADFEAQLKARVPA